MTERDSTLLAEYRPEKKIVAAAVATILVWLGQLIFPEVEVPPGVEGAVAVVVGYLVPNGA